ncbi:MAG TPA: hypothetical protein VK537_09065 [Galbitalea sp.]|nr:hypothetical protein [Galbitalea sp.]
MQSRFDWYEATVDNDTDSRTAPSLALVLGAHLVRGKGRNGYAECWQLVRDDIQLCEVYGRSARLGEVHITVTSESCDEVVPVLRRMYPEHRVSRADAAVDVHADFETLDLQVLAFAVERGLSYAMMTGSDGGATRRIGSPRSETMLRVYKKTEQLRALHPEIADTIPDGVVRFELVARPGKRAVKESLSTMSADDVWGLSQWSTEFASFVVGFEAERTATHFRRPSNYRRALHFVGIQYGPLMRDRAAEIGREATLLELAGALGL